MFGFRKLNNSVSGAEETFETATKKTSLFSNLTRGLMRTRQHFSQGLANLFLGKKAIDAALLEEIEGHLLSADVGVSATQRVIQEITATVKRKELGDSDALLEVLKQALLKIIAPSDTTWTIPPENKKPYVILMVGVNGAGKTTTIGKLANYFKSQGKKVLLAAGDTFRAAAIEQLKVWGERNQISVIAQHHGADSASVVYDALEAAQARNTDVLIIDTAGRLHTQMNLMKELEKIKKVMGKLDPEAPHETILVLDAGIGQNALRQAQQFNESVKIKSLVLTKLDGTAKGGIIFSLAENMHLPIRFIGVGEKIEDLQPFNAKNFIDALFGGDK